MLLFLMYFGDWSISHNELLHVVKILKYSRHREKHTKHICTLPSWAPYWLEVTSVLSFRETILLLQLYHQGVCVSQHSLVSTVLELCAKAFRLWVSCDLLVCLMLSSPCCGK